MIHHQEQRQCFRLLERLESCVPLLDEFFGLSARLHFGASLLKEVFVELFAERRRKTKHARPSGWKRQMRQLLRTYSFSFSLLKGLPFLAPKGAFLKSLFEPKRMNKMLTELHRKKLPKEKIIFSFSTICTHETLAFFYLPIFQLSLCGALNARIICSPVLFAPEPQKSPFSGVQAGAIAVGERPIS